MSGRVVGDVYLWLSPADEPEVRERLPGVPLVNHLEVHPGHQKRGIGTKLITEAEEIARALGHRQIALGVGVDNLRARRLYQARLPGLGGRGAVGTSYRVHLDDGATRSFSETIHVLTKFLAPA